MNGTRGRKRGAAWVMAAVLLGSASITVLALAGQHLAVPGGPWMLVTMAAVAGMSVTAEIARRIDARAVITEGRGRTRLLIVGAGTLARHVAREAEQDGAEVLGFVEDPEAGRGSDWPRGVVGTTTALPQLIRELAVRRIIVAEDPARGWDLMARLEGEGALAEVFIVPGLYELALCDPTNTRIGDVALLRLSPARASAGYRAAKRFIDVTASLFLLGAFGPLLLLAMVLIRMSSKGPALFRQERVGKDGRRFMIVKFRTMFNDAEKEGPQLCTGLKDPRLTLVGRFLRRTHLDELPQLWNVLRGEMSLVGPRPERPWFVERFVREMPEYALRHRVLPGITGLAQVNGFYHSTPREKLRYDLMYLHHPSLWQDLRIIARTALAFLHY